MKIGQYISDLLFENDFVILPDMGEFSTKYIPAKFIPELKKVESPSKVISFNEKNKTGGGLLIEYIAKKEDISNQQAKEFISKFTNEMKNSLLNGKKVDLEKVGSFIMSEEGKLIFDPDTSINYLSESMGMPSVKEPEKKNEEEAKTELDKALEESELPKDQDKKTKDDASQTTIGSPTDVDKGDKSEKEKTSNLSQDNAPEKSSDEKEPKVGDDQAKDTSAKPKEIKTVISTVNTDKENKEKQVEEKKDQEKKDEKEKDIKPSGLAGSSTVKSDVGSTSTIKTVSASSKDTSESQKPKGAAGISRTATGGHKPLNFSKSSAETPGSGTDSSLSKRSSSSKEGLSPALKWVAITVVPLLIIILVLAFNYDYIFGDKSIIWNNDEALTEQTSTNTEPINEESQSGDADTSAAADQQTTTDESATNIAGPSDPEPGRKTYYVIVGSFEEEHSALILADELREQGAVNARVFPINNQGFYRVAYGFYYDLNEAERVMQQYGKEISSEAWVLHR